MSVGVAVNSGVSGVSGGVVSISDVSGVTGGALRAEEQAAITRRIATTTVVSKLDALAFIENVIFTFLPYDADSEAVTRHDGPIVHYNGGLCICQVVLDGCNCPETAGGRQMVIPIIVSTIFVLAVVVLCLAKPNAGQIFLGLFFLVMAIGVNITTFLEILRSKLRPQ